MIHISAVKPRLNLTLEFADWRLHEPSSLSCCLSALVTCLARFLLSPVPCSSSALPASLSFCGHCPWPFAGLCSPVSSGKWLRMMLSISQSSSFSSHRRIWTGKSGWWVGVARHRIPFKIGISSCSCYQSSGDLRLSLFRGRDCRLSSSWKECEWPVKSKISYVCPRAPVSLRKVPQWMWFLSSLFSSRKAVQQHGMHAGTKPGTQVVESQCFGIK